LKFYSCGHKNVQNDRTYVSVGDFHMFEQDSALAHRTCKVVAFWITRRLISCPHVAQCWHDKHLLLANQIKFTIEAG